MKKSNLLFVLLVALLSACGNNPSSDTTSTPDTDSGSTGKVEIKNPWWETTGELSYDNDGNVEFEDVEIDLATVVAGEDLSTFKEIVDQFNSEYRNKIRVNVSSINQSEFEDTVSKRITNNDNPPDLIMSHQKGHKMFSENKLIQPFDEAMEESNNIISLDDYAIGLAEYADLGYTGYTFGVPIDAQSNVVYYNKTLLEQYSGNLPTTRAELLDLCSQVKTGENITPIAWMTSSSDFFKWYTFRTAILQNGGTLYDTSTYEVDWYSNETNRTAYKNAIQSIREIVNLGYADYDLPEATATSRFVENKALFYVGLPWNCNSLLQSYSNSNGSISIDTVKDERVGATSIANWFCLDSTSGNGDKIYGDSHFFAMSRSCKKLEEKAAAVEFVRWFTQTPSVGIKWAQAGHITASNIINTSEEYQADSFIKDFINMWYPSINDLVSAGINPYYETIFDNLDQLFVDTKGTNGSNDESSIRGYEEDINDEIGWLK